MLQNKKTYSIRLNLLGIRSFDGNAKFKSAVVHNVVQLWKTLFINMVF